MFALIQTLDYLWRLDQIYAYRQFFSVYMGHLLPFFLLAPYTFSSIAIIPNLGTFSVLNAESINHGPGLQRRKRDASFSELGPLNDNERHDLNCAVKEYLLLAGYRLTAMTFYEEV